MKRQGIWCAAMKSAHVVRKRKTKTVEERGSSEKFVGGVIIFRKASWMVLKSSILFCRSRMLRKKSLDISPAGLMVRAGASGGPVKEYVRDVVVGFGGGGWRAMYAGTMTKNRAPAMGRTERRYGSRQTKVHMASRDRVCEGFLQVKSRSTRF